MARVRLRSRPRRRPADSWLPVRGAEGSTPIGNLDSPVRAAVDPAGLVAVAGRTWALDWWVGAEDRWHVPAREVAVRQALVGNSPVVETRVRVPGGDAVHRAYGARGPAGEDLLVVEVRNDTSVPFALALALRPYGLDGTGRIDRLAWPGGAVVEVDGAPALVLPRAPGRLALSTAAEGDVAHAVFAGDAAVPVAQAVRCSAGAASGALLFPLAHTATLRVVVPLDGTADGLAVAQLPSADQVASGWARQSQAGARIEVPNRRLRDAVAASTRFALLGAATSTDPSVAAALDLMGFPVDAASVLLRGGAHDLARPGAALAAIGRHWAVTRDRDVGRALVEPVAGLVPALARADDPDDRAAGRRALVDVAAMLEAVGEQRAAADARTLAGGGQASAAEAVLDGLLATATPTWTWPDGTAGHDLRASATVLSSLRDLLVGEGPDGLALCPVVPEAWLGQGWEVHDLTTGHGALSFAVRWHGERPALLWELVPSEPAGAIALTVPGLDPAWSTTAPRGDALLAPVAVPERPTQRRGLTIPVTIEPMRRPPP